MQVFKGTFKPPAAAPTMVVLPIAGAGRCEISKDGVVFKGFKTSVSLKSFALALGAGAAGALAAWLAGSLVGFDWDLQEIVGAGACAMIAVGAASVQRFDRNKPVRYAVSFDGVESVAPCEESAGTLLIKVPGVKRKAAIFFRPAVGGAAFVGALERRSGNAFTRSRDIRLTSSGLDAIAANERPLALVAPDAAAEDRGPSGVVEEHDEGVVAGRQRRAGLERKRGSARAGVCAGGRGSRQLGGHVATGAGEKERLRADL